VILLVVLRIALSGDLLAPIYAWFTEGLDTPVLQDGKALLDQLGAYRIHILPKYLLWVIRGR
jgi:hypothetical protein